MTVEILCVGKLKERYWKEAVQEYGKRLERFCSFQVKEVKEARIPEDPSPGEIEKAVKEEGANLLRALKNGTYLTALEIEGKQLSSEKLAAELENNMNRGRSHLTYVIGGSHGLSPEVLKRADFRLSFSPMTFPHQMMRVILAEQIYRSFKIMNHETYHK